MTHVLPPLAYGYAALEPHLDERTLRLHHGAHHAGYVKALNQALDGAPAQLQGKSAQWLLLNPDQVPADLRATVHNNAGGHVNHSLLWRSMAPSGAGSAPTDRLAGAIEEAFGTLQKFKAKFVEAGSTLFGSGWVWLVQPAQGEGALQVVTTTGHDNPLAQGLVPLLVNDVWEHAYYLKHENRRADYLKGWWAVADWNAAALRHGRALAGCETE